MALAEQEQEVDTKEQLFLAYYAQGAHYAQGMRDLLEARVGVSQNRTSLEEEEQGEEVVDR